MKRLSFMLLLIVMALLTSFTASIAAQEIGRWTANYYNNRNLQGVPVVQRVEASPSFNAGQGSPVPGVNADDFSARWTTTRLLPAGTYRFTAFADDGVRVYVDNGLIIDEWHLARGEQYTADVVLAQGTHTITVEYFEANIDAFLNFDFSAIQSLDPPAIGQSTATVEVPTLNVRTEPDIVYGDVITRIEEGEVYPAVALNEDDTWVRINVNGTLGWVSRAYVNLENTQTLPRVTEEPPTPGTTPIATVIATDLNVRSLPSVERGRILTRVERGEQYRAVARNAANTWVQINVDGTFGWVSNRFVDVDNATGLPVAQDPDAPSPRFAANVTATPSPYNVNIRSGPGVTFADVGNLPVNQTAEVIGRNANGTWWQIEYGGLVGWVADQFVVVNGPQQTVPITG